MNSVTETKILLSSPHMGGTEQKYVQEAFDTNWIAPLGNNVNEFEKQVKEFTGSQAACALSSGTAGIHIALDLLDVKQDDVVFCSSLTFIASANPILYLGAEPVFIDSDLESWNMSPIALEKAFKAYEAKDKLPKAVVIVRSEERRVGKESRYRGRGAVQAEDGIRDRNVTGVQTCALPIYDVVFCSSLTFIASANPILYLGAEPVFIDSDLESWNMSPIALEKAFKAYEAKDKLPKAVVIV